MVKVKLMLMLIDELVSGLAVIHANRLVVLNNFKD